MNVLCFGYKPFHQSPISYSGTEGAPILQFGVPEKSSISRCGQDAEKKCGGDHSGQVPAFCNRLFLVKNASGRWRPVIDLSSLKPSLLFANSGGSSHLLLERGHYVLDRSERYILPDSFTHGIEITPAIHSEQEDASVESFALSLP